MGELTTEPLGSAYVLTNHAIGRGAMGRVYVGYRREDGTPLAVKILRPELAEDPEIVTRFLRERSVLLGITHPNLVQVHDLIVEGGKVAVVMDLIDGIDLRRLLTDEGSISEPAALSLASETLSALAAVHAQHIVHRDIKPENILLDQQGHGHVADFGIAKIMTSRSMTRLTGVIGTPEYMAPESVESNEGGPAGDIYSTGILLYELISGSTPFAGGHAVAVLRRHLEDDPVRPSEMSDPVWALTTLMLSKDPAARPTAADAAAQIGTITPSEVADAPRLIAPAIIRLSMASRELEPTVHETISASRAVLGLDDVGHETILAAGRERREAPTTPSPISPGTAAVAVATPAVPAPVHGAGAQPRTRRNRKWLVAALAAIVIAGLAVGIVATRTPAASPIRLKPVSAAVFTVLAPKWTSMERLTLGGAQDRVLTGTLAVDNGSSSADTFIQDLVIPTQMANRASDVSTNPHASVAVSDPVLDWRKTLNSAKTFRASFSLPIARYNISPKSELALFIKDQKDAEIAYLHGLKRQSLLDVVSPHSTKPTTGRSGKGGKPSKTKATLAQLTTSSTNLTVLEGHSVTITATGRLSNGVSWTGAKLSGARWSSDNTSAATVKGTGATATVTGVHSGSATITVTLDHVSTDVFVQVGKPASTVHKPSAPTHLVETAATPTSVTISWKAPSNDGGASVSGYTVSGAGSCTSGTTKCVISGLAKGSTGRVCVEAINAAGPGSKACATIETVGTPGAPRSVSPPTPSSYASQVTVSWLAPLDSDAWDTISGYTVSGTGSGCTSTTTSCVVSGLQPNTSVKLCVTATDQAGAGATVCVTFTDPPTTPSAPTGISVSSVGDSSATINWNAPSNFGGTSSVSYTVSGAGSGCSTGSTSCSVSGLGASTGYTVCVIARNSAGNSSSDCTSFTTAAPPPSISISKGSAYNSSEYWTTMTVSNFPTGSATFSCHFSDGTDGPYDMTVSSANQTWSPSGTGSGVGCYAGGLTVYISIDAHNGTTYTSNTVSL